MMENVITHVIKIAGSTLVSITTNLIQSPGTLKSRLNVVHSANTPNTTIAAFALGILNACPNWTDASSTNDEIEFPD